MSGAGFFLTGLTGFFRINGIGDDCFWGTLKIVVGGGDAFVSGLPFLLGMVYRVCRDYQEGGASIQTGAQMISNAVVATKLGSHGGAAGGGPGGSIGRGGGAVHAAGRMAGAVGSAGGAAGNAAANGARAAYQRVALRGGGSTT